MVEEEKNNFKKFKNEVDNIVIQIQGYDNDDEFMIKHLHRFESLLDEYIENIPLINDFQESEEVCQDSTSTSSDDDTDDDEPVKQESQQDIADRVVKEKKEQDAEGVGTDSHAKSEESEDEDVPQNVNDEGKAESDTKIQNDINEIEPSKATEQPNVYTEYIIQQLIPPVVKVVIKNKFVDENLKKEGNEFLRKILGVITIYMPWDQFNVVKLLNHIFDDDKKFYQDYYQNKPRMGFLSSNYGKTNDTTAVGRFATAPKYQSKVPAALVHNVNYFGEIGGFKAILNRVLDLEDKSSLDIIQVLTDPLVNIRRILKEDFLENWVVEFCKGVFNLFESYTDTEMKQIQKKQMSYILDRINALLSSATSATKAAKQTESFKLAFAFKSLKSETLQQRLNGINTINDLITMIYRSESRISRGVWYSNPGHMGQYGRNYVVQPTAQWLDSAFMLNWLNEHNIIEELFGDRIHEELVKRSEDIFKFLVQKEEITEATLKLMWEASIGKSETLISAIYSSLCDLAPNLTAEQITFLLDKIKSKSISDFDSDTLTLLKKLTVNSINESKFDDDDPLQWEGLNIFWNLIQDENGLLTPELQKQTLSCLYKILERPFASPVRNTYMERCVQNLKDFKVIYPSLKLLKKIINSYPKSKMMHRRSDQTTTSAIESLNESHDLLKLIFNELTENYKKKYSQQQNLSDSTKDDNMIEEQILQLEIRLNFIKFILEPTSLSLTIEHINILWDTLVEKSNCQIEIDTICSWFQAICDKNRENIFFSDVTKYLFEEKICNIDPILVSTSVFNCFEKYFRFINGQEKNLEFTQYHFVVKDFNLIGLESLWKITLQTATPEVSETANDYLNGLYKKASQQIKKDMGTLFEGYIEKVMHYLTESSNVDNITKKEELILTRCLSLLKNFIDEFDTSNSSSPIGESRGEPLALKLAPLKDGPKHEFLFYSKDTLGDLRKKVARKILASEQSVRLITMGKTLKNSHMDKTLDQLGIHDHQILYFDLESTHGAHVGSPPPQSSMERVKLQAAVPGLISPSNILCMNQNHFQQLFKLLEVPCVTKTAWNLIKLLPINPKLLNDVQSLQNGAETVEWNNLLDPNSTYKLLYALQIVESIIENNDSLRKSTEHADWCDTFEQKGGLKHIFETFMTQKDLHIDVLCKELSIISMFLIQSDSRISLNTSENWVQPKDLIERLIFIIWETGKKYDPDHVEEQRTNQNQNQNETKLGKLTKNCSTLLAACIYNNPELINFLYKLNSFKEFIYYVLLVATDSGMRNQIMKFIGEICSILTELDDKSIMPPQAYFLEILIGFLEKVETSYDSEQYFTLFVILLDKSLKEEGNFDENSPKKLFETVTEMITNHPIIETSDTQIECDTNLVGLLKVALSLIKFNSDFKKNLSNFVREIFFKCLFELPTQENHGKFSPPKCKTKQSRLSALELLEELAKNCSKNYILLTDLIIEHHIALKSLMIDPTSDITEYLQNNKKNWGYSPKAASRHESGFVGLKNLGCTCYMNSLLQQLYHQPKFRRGILSLEPKEKIKEEDKSESFIYQLQRMFSFLQESLKQYYNPGGFCHANKDYDGNPTNVGIQMDVDEFFNMFCEKVENELKGTMHENLLTNIWSGKITSQLICNGCPHKSERSESFSALSVDIKNKSNVEEALEMYVKGEMLDGDNAYYCEPCSLKRDTLKRTVISSLPNTLIIHLKRFDFDFDTFRKVKLHDYCSFPMQLNMEPYTKEGLAKKDAALNKNNEQTEENTETENSVDEKNSKDVNDKEDEGEDENNEKEKTEETIERDSSYYEYNLVGILIHRGDSESGHYYSYIKTKQKSGNEEIEKWYEFNDHDVLDFDPEDIETECFGGTETISDTHPFARRHVEQVLAKTRSAYMLIYERIKPYEVEQEKSESKSEENSPTGSESEESDSSSDGKISTKGAFLASVFITKLNKLVQKQQMTDAFTVSVPPKLSKEVWQDNMNYLLDKKLFDGDYFSFISDILALGDDFKNKPDLHMKVTQLGALFFIEVLSHAKTSDKSKVLQTFRDNLCQLFKKNQNACSWFVNILTLDSSLTQKILIECPIVKVRKIFATLISYVISRLLKVQQSQLLNFKKEEKPSVLNFLDMLLSLMSYHPWKFHFFDQFFTIFREFALLGSIQVQYLLSKPIISRMISFYLEKENQNGKEKGSLKIRRSDLHAANFYDMIHLISILITCTLKKPDEDSDSSEEEEEDDDPMFSPEQLLQESNLELLQDDFNEIMNPKFLGKLFSQGIHTEKSAKLAAHLCWEDKNNSRTILLVILENPKTGIDDIDYHSLENLFDVLGYILGMKDQLQKGRASFVMEKFVQILQENKRYIQKTRESINWLSKISKQNKHVNKWVEKNKNKLQSIEHWLDRNSGMGSMGMNPRMYNVRH